MSAGSLARRYAKALMQLGEEQNNYEKLGSELSVLAGAMTASDELRDTLTNPLFQRSDRQNVIEAVLARIGASPTIKNFSLLLLDRERLAAVPAISRELDGMIDDKIGRVNAEVWSATKLNPGQEAQIRTELEKLSGKTVDMTSSHDPSLLGGVVARVGDVVYDGSLKTQLQHIKAQLSK
ncbi:MAG: ATP synthase F1 subunit delta [Deltaproteobacteria bacterium]|nr:ATP synthase F1 subunit delta [Deltaproteobacteria bacterium]